MQYKNDINGSSINIQRRKMDIKQSTTNPKALEIEIFLLFK